MLFVICLILIDFMIKGKERLNFKIPNTIDLLGSVLLVLIVVFFYNKSSSFIYFQF
ncbi:hypothetical protein Flav3CDRAFT_1387 [Flavobacteria bacterium MS024-3C]|nr:hypothetical protein Flav3CDRAFT_1387 [Flavobacteria bacterium MS024-3C]